MKTISNNGRLARRAYWLVKLRWIAIAGTVVAIFIAGNVLNMAIQSVPLYCVAAMLALENIVSLLLLNHQLKRRTVSVFSVGRIIHFQICIDLVILTTLLHYSGGIENPFIIYFVFHMVIASILLPARESYLQATFATGLLILLALLEHKGIIAHYCIKEFIANSACSNAISIFATIVAMASTLYLVVYMTSNIATKLRKQEEAYLQINAELKQKDKIKDEYVSRVTHDIKGHLAAIQTCLDVVQKNLFGSLNEKQADFVDRAHSRTCKLTKFVRTLLELTQMRLSNNLEMSVFSLPEIVGNSLETVKIKVQSKSITLNSEIESSLFNC
jgi:signal transduction histidine kinase